MKRSSYCEQDYAFGQAKLTLHTTIRMTQEGLAAYLGVSRKAVSRWEAGVSYPKAEHLKALLALAVEHQAFLNGREEEGEAKQTLLHQTRASPPYVLTGGRSLFTSVNTTLITTSVQRRGVTPFFILHLLVFAEHRLQVGSDHGFQLAFACACAWSRSLLRAM